jgi:hypothetical protein
LTKFRLGAQELLHGRDVIRSDRVLKPPPHIQRINVLLEFGPAWEAVPSRDLKLRVGKCRSGAGTHEIFGLIAEMAKVG